MKRILFSSALALLASTSAWAGGISVSDPHVRLVPASAENTGIFMVIKNDGDKDVKLVQAMSNVSKEVELHTVVNENGMMKMRPVPYITIKAKSETVLKPGSFHVMLIGLKRPVVEGQKVPVMLHFDDGSMQDFTAPVRPIQMLPPAKQGAPK